MTSVFFILVPVPARSTRGVSDVSVTSASPVQATGEVAVNLNATQPVEGPSTRRGDVISKNATQPVEAPGAGTPNQPLEAPGAGPKVLLTGTDNDATQLDESLTSGKSADITGGSDSEEELDSEPGSPGRLSRAMTQLTWISLKKLITERLSEGSDLSWVGARFLTSTVLHLP